MGIFSRKNKKNPKNSLSTSRLFFWGGASSAGTYVNERNAMQTAAVYACVRVIAEAVASLPLHVYKYDGDGQKIAPDHSLYKVLHNIPNPEMTSFVFRETLMSHVLLWGNAYAEIRRDGGGRVRALYPLAPDKIDVNRDKSGEIYYTYWRDSDERRKDERSGGVIFRREEILHIPGLSFDGLVGYSPISLAKNSVGLSVAAEDYGAAFFSNGASPSGVLEHPSNLGDDGIGKIRDAWDVIHRGARNSGKVAILEDGLKYHTIAIPPEQAQFLETRKFQINEICRIFRVPPHMIGDLEKSSFSNIEQQSLEFVKYTLDPWVSRWEQALWQSLILPSEQERFFIKFNVDGLLRGDYETRMKGYAIGIQNGFLSPNDCRRLENMNEIPDEQGGNKYMVNGNMVSLENVGAAYHTNSN